MARTVPGRGGPLPPRSSTRSPTATPGLSRGTPGTSTQPRPRTLNASKTRNSQLPPVLTDAGSLAEDADIRQVAELLRVVEPVADDEEIRNREAEIIDGARLLHARRL